MLAPEHPRIGTRNPRPLAQEHLRIRIQERPENGTSNALPPQTTDPPAVVWTPCRGQDPLPWSGPPAVVRTPSCDADHCCGEGRPAGIITSERYYVIKPQLIQQRSGVAILLPAGGGGTQSAGAGPRSEVEARSQRALHPRSEVEARSQRALHPRSEVEARSQRALHPRSEVEARSQRALHPRSEVEARSQQALGLAQRWRHAVSRRWARKYPARLCFVLVCCAVTGLSSRSKPGRPHSESSLVTGIQETTAFTRRSEPRPHSVSRPRSPAGRSPATQRITTSFTTRSEPRHSAYHDLVHQQVGAPATQRINPSGRLSCLVFRSLLIVEEVHTAPLG
ncbi:unnamed protein product [Boreogadus saida]